MCIPAVPESHPWAPAAGNAADHHRGIQAPVVPNAPFQCILGTPFCAISSLEMMWRPSAEMAVKLTDPNHENKTVLVPATVRGSRRRVLSRAPDF